MTRRAASLGLIATLAGVSGCHSSTVRSGLPPGAVPASADQQRIDSLAFGTIELEEPTDLTTHCPLGWSQIHTETTFGNGFLTVVTLGVYSPRTFTIVCAATGAAAGAPSPAAAQGGGSSAPREYPPPRRPEAHHPPRVPEIGAP